MLWWTQLADYGRFSQCTLICIYSTGTTLKKQHISRGEIRLAIKWYIIITSSTDAHWTEPLIAAGPECCEFVIFFIFKRQHMFLYRPVSKEWRLYLACSSTAQPATGLIRTLMPYTHRMSSKLRLFLEQYAQGVSGRAPVATYAPHPVLENITVDPWAQVTSNLSFIILQSKKLLFLLLMYSFV